MEMTIRDARPADAATIADYNSRMAEETEGTGLDPELIGAGVAALLADSSKGRYWVAELGDEIIGQIMITYEYSDWRHGTIWWIQSVYVHPAHRRRGVFSSLYRHVENLAMSTPDVVGIRLYVEKDNGGAQATYARLGMKPTNYFMLQSMFGRDTRFD